MAHSATTCCHIARWKAASRHCLFLDDGGLRSGFAIGIGGRLCSRAGCWHWLAIVSCATTSLRPPASAAQAQWRGSGLIYFASCAWQFGDCLLLAGAPIRHRKNECPMCIGLQSFRLQNGYRSFGDRPVCFAIRASIFGPISSPSWKAKTKSGQPFRQRVLCEPDCRLICQLSRNREARSRLALTDGHWLMLQLVWIYLCQRDGFRYAQAVQQ